MPKVTIYLPDELAEHVRAVGISMSPVCQKALEEQVRKVNAALGVDREARNIAERLLTTAGGERSGRYAEGFVLGVKWASESATLSELRHLVELDVTVTGAVQFEGTHSFPQFLGRQPGYESWAKFEPTPASNQFRLERDPWMDGVIAGAWEVYTRVTPYL